MALRFIARLEQFKDSLLSLEKINVIEWPADENLYGFIWCGVIVKFCITFDLSYKLAKDILIEYHGITHFAKGSPREILRESFQAHVINDKKWLDMLKNRNEIVHEYTELSAVDGWCKKISEEYIPLFRELLSYAESIMEQYFANYFRGGFKMRSDSVLRSDVVNILIKELGEVEVELKKEDFNYTDWQRKLWNDLKIDEVYNLAKEREDLSFARKKTTTDA